MAETDTSITLISKDKPAYQSMDYTFLRAEGIKYIQSLASETWTDHNIHDPGITILEILSYAITDLGSRATKPIEDLLASKPNALETEKDFFSAAEILPCNPITVNDFRKFLIDHEDIRNAWLAKSEDSEKIFYLDRESKKLTYEDGERIYVNGLYKILVELEEDDEFGDLSSGIIVTEIENGVPAEIKKIEVAFPFWDEVLPPWKSLINITGITLQDQGSGGLKQLGSNGLDFFAVMNVTYTGGTDQIGITIHVPSGIQDAAVELPLIESKLQETGANSLAVKFNKKIMRTKGIIEIITEYINNKRNLSEDFYSIGTSRIQEIGVSATLEIASGIVVEQILAEIFYSLEKFISPVIKFYTLDEMLGKGISADEIFEGPLLKYGFIDNDELNDENKRGNTIYTSDLINVIMKLNKVLSYSNSSYANQNKSIISIMDLKISNFINNQLITSNVRNCLKLTLMDIYKPKLSISKSNIKVLKNSIEVKYDIDSVIDIFNAKKQQDNIIKSSVDNDLPIPTGNNLDVEEYYSIQNEFPQAYGIGYSGLPKDADDERKVQAKQLKGFLLFFEQLLANYLSQLAHVRDLFSIYSSENDTYFWQQLTSVPDVSPLLKSTYATHVPDFLKGFEFSASGFGRRNSFLDHLIAQFGEDFTDYALLMYSKYGSDFLDTLIRNKSNFLKEYSINSINRPTSFNYLGRNRLEFFKIEAVHNMYFIVYKWTLKNEEPDDLLVSEFFSTIESANANIALVSGFGKNKNNYAVTTLATGKKTFQISDPSTSLVIAKSAKEFDTEEAAKLEINKCISFLSDTWDTDNVPWLKKRICGLLGIEDYRQSDLANANREGFHLIENILLRPKVNDVIAGNVDKFLEVELDSHDQIIESKTDPYSFRIMFIFPIPSEPPEIPDPMKRFRDPDFKIHIEKVIHKETPAHIMPEIYWIDNVKMQLFESAYKEWLLSITAEKNQAVLTTIKNQFLDFLNSIITLA